MRGLNILTVCMLGAVLLGILWMPRFNYQTLALQQTKAEAEQKRLAQHLARLEQLLGTETDGAHYAATFQTLGSIPPLLESVQAEIGSLAGHLSRVESQLGVLTSRVQVLEAGLEVGSLTPGPASPANDGDQRQPIDLPTALRAQADRLSARALAEGTFEEFLSHALDNGLVPNPTGQVSPEIYEGLLRLYSLYTLNIRLVNYEESLRIRELAEEAAASGEYDEISLASEEEELRRHTITEQGILHVQTVAALGVKRIFRFTVVDHPEFLELYQQRENVRDHLVAGVGRLLESEDRKSK